MAYKIGKCLLRQRLRDAGMTQYDLARSMGVTAQQINKYAVSRQKMSLQTAKNIASIVECSIEDLYEWIEVSN